MSRPEQRAILLALEGRVQTKSDAVEISLQRSAETPTCVRVDSRLAKKGMELRFTIPPDDGNVEKPDDVLLRLVAHARAAESLIVDGKPAPCLGNYSKAHLQRLLRLAWLAPDILTAIVEGKQPVTLTGRRLLRTAQIPLEWAEQRRMLAFT